MKEPKVAIIICTYNQEKLLEISLRSLKEKTNYKNYKVFLIDDFSPSKIGEKMKKKFSWIDLTVNSVNKGFGGANNVGITKAMKENFNYILLLNDDIEICDKDWLKKMVKAGEENKNSGILGLQVIYPDGELQNVGNYINKFEIVKIENFEKNSTFKVDSVMGCSFLIKKKVIEKVGLLDEIYNPFLLEETDYCLRAKKKGFEILSVSSAKLIHKKGKSIDSLGSNYRTFVRFKNDIVFSLRHLKFPWNLFRIFIYLPMVATFKKKHDNDALRLKNFVLRKNFIINWGILIWAFIYDLRYVRRIWK